MVIIDTDVLLLAFAFHHDPRQATNKLFLDNVVNHDPALTIYNLMELLGQMSFNLAPSRLAQWRSWLADEYHLTVLFPTAPENQSADTFYRSEIFVRAFDKINKQRMGYLDALVLDLAERISNVEQFITWNARHFKGKTSLNVETPSEYLAHLR